MKRKTKASTKSMSPSNVAAGLVPETVAIIKKTNGTNGKHKPRVATNGITDHGELDVHELLRVLAEIRNGNFSVRMPIDKLGINGKICDTLNDIISLNEILVEELTIARNTIGKQARLNHRA